MSFFLYPVPGNDLVAFFPESEGLVNHPIEVVIELPVSARRPEDRYAVFPVSVPVPGNDLVAFFPESEGLVNHPIEVVIEVPVSA